MMQLQRSYRILAAISVIWMVIANLLYFDAIKLAMHECSLQPNWIKFWQMFTLGIDGLFPYDTILGDPGFGSGPFICIRAYYFDGVGYAYFLIGPIAILVGAYFLYQWAMKQSSSATTVE